MAENNNFINVGGRLHSIATGNVLAGTDEIYDDGKGKKQSTINAETDAILAQHTSVIQGLNSQNYETYAATNQTTAVTDVLPATGNVNTVYRLGNWDGSQFDSSCYTEYSWDGTQYVPISTKTQIDEVFDISAYHASGDILATYADLSAALDSNNGGGVPQSLQRGGMSIKFVCSSDNKYVQYRLMSNTFSTTESDWQGVDNEPTAGSDNLIKSGGVAEQISQLEQEINKLKNAGYLYAGIAIPTTNPSTPNSKVFYIANGKGIYINFENLEVTEDEVVIFYYDTVWHKVSTGIASHKTLTFFKEDLEEKITRLEQKVESEYVIASFSIDGSIRKDGNIYVAKAAKRTNFIKVKEGIKIKAYDGATSYPEYAAVAFYNANFKFISTMDFSTNGLKEITLTSSNIPSNAEYFIASTINTYLSDSYVKFTDSNISIISDSVVNMEFNGVKDDSSSLFTKHYFIFENKLYTNEELSISTDFLPVDGISDIFFWQLLEQDTGKVVAFFDENKKLMSDYGVNGVDSTILCGKVEIPIGAKWVMFITRKNVFNSNIRISFNSIRGINLMIGDLYTKVGNNKSSVDSLTSSVDSLTSSVDSLAHDVQNVTEYSNALKGVSFGTTEGDILFKNALKKVWIQILDPSFNATTLKLVHLCNKSNEQYNPWIAFYDQNNNYAISWYGNNPTPKTGVQHLVINGFNTYSNRFYLHLVIDWDEIQEKKFTAGLQTTMDVSKLNKVDIDTRTVAEQLIYASNDWKDNTIVCFGDSITEFKDSFRMSYTDYLKQFTGANIINIGIGGTQFRQRAIPVSSPSSNNEAYASLDIINIVKACCEQDFTNQIAANDWLKDKEDNNTAIINRMIAIDWSKVNAVTFFAGTNDWNNAAGQWGESGSSDVNTTLGAINEIIRLILTTYPHIRIYWFTPIVRWLNERIPENFSDSFVRGTKTLKEFSAMIQTEVERHHIPVCDMYNTLGWNMYNFSNYFTDTDGTHPEKGYMAIARKIKGFIDANRTF